MNEIGIGMNEIEAEAARTETVNLRPMGQPRDLRRNPVSEG
jgi:hypothetical protein